ncbi:hypothetical protein WGE86_21465 [Xanthomonas euvesicatoria pv. euvesicatoria]|uniref:hypothetical protein n=1 Tax=Xanthomonas TaxID=338 RepID=UPI0009385BAD|nr:hypothetical protein [Xanthomonas euvesicatoria]APO88885.1 hypothetical protein BJD11_01590 [Xanthomonas euvesicatoria]MCC8514698.1 hypothetical protein [Xanthomonas euvesicatoria pv. euvesicatoria]MCC8547760.1 hypothetical protein [Xanthomonas euvesicatoria pv. euvesicatoria]MCC8612541.1 hypothetical protein [Xanthomonas euvesicatoria pv. euvesicatoria]
MSDPTDKDKQPEYSGVDIFNMKPDTKAGDQAGKTQDRAAHAAKPRAAALQGFASKLGPAHFAVAALVIAGAWIAWPYMFGGSSGDTATTTRMLIPDQAMSDANRAQQQYQVSANQAPASAPTTPASSPAATDVALAGVASVATAATAASSPLPASETAAQAQSAKEAELQAKVDDLQGKLAAAEAQPAKCPATAAAATASVSKPKHRVRRVSTTPRRYATSTTVMRIGTGTTKPGDFTLNTVYRDQAWIQNSERTYVVQAGDVIDGMRIVRVDASTRQVVTSLGTIR